MLNIISLKWALGYILYRCFSLAEEMWLHFTFTKPRRRGRIRGQSSTLGGPKEELSRYGHKLEFKQYAKERERGGVGVHRHKG